jgi:DNA-directed RNA polymerase specialized sigma24 family protein
MEEVVVKKKKKSVQYFTKDTENAIVRYNNTEDSEIRSAIYRDEIHYAFFKLTENIIHTFKFYYTEVENIEDLQHEVITFLLSKIHRFNPENGAKAYSYFGTITKRWLILYNQKNYKKRVDAVDIEVIEEDEKFSYELEDTQPIERLSYYIDEYVKHCTDQIFKLFPKEEDAKIADAVLELFRKREHLDIFNKKALYIYIREIVDAKTPKITKITTKLYDIFKAGYSFYLEHGYVKFSS